MGRIEKVTVELDSEAVKAAADAGLDLSRVLSDALRRWLPEPQTAEERERAGREWYEANKAAVDSYNEFIEKHGVFSDGVRTF